MDLRLAGRRAIVTGGSHGIGRVITKALLAEGVRVVIAARDAERLKTAAAELAADPGGTVIPIVADTGSDEAVRVLVARTVDELGGVDILVNNAAQPGGAGSPGGVTTLSTAAAAEDFNVKVLGYLRTAQAVTPHFIEQGWGRIINIGGLAARQVGLASGSIRNVGVAALTKTLADELGPHGGNVTVVHPGATPTESLAALTAEDPQRFAAFTGTMSIGRIMTADEVAAVVTWKRSVQAPSFRVGLADSRWPPLPFDVLSRNGQRCSADGPGEVGRRPEVAAHRVLVHLAGELGAQPPGGDSFEAVHQRGHGDLRRVVDKQMDVIVFAVELGEGGAEVFAHVGHDLPTAVQHRHVQHTTPVLRHEDQMHVERGNHMPSTPVVVILSHRPSMVGVVSVIRYRYRYRVYPSPGQVQALARAFGCARVVYNDAIRTRDAAHKAGEKISDTEVQRRVVTLAKQTPEREWLGEVSSVVLVQACQDARRAFRNWFDSLSGKRKGRRARHPRLRSRKDNRQSIRLTRNGFSVLARGVRVAKVGDLTLEWSRPLPSVPSSVTVIREADGRYYASFVVEVEDIPYPATESEVGVDLGLDRLATLSTGDVVTNPRHLWLKQRRLAHAQRALSRKEKGSANRRKAVCRVAALHRKVRETRRDHHHKLAARLVRDNQAIYVEDLAVVGLARTKLARSVHDAGWSQFVGMLEYKAARYGRTVVKVGRFFPSSQVCSVCGVKDGPKPLSVRSWTCPACGTGHDRDVNAARNVLYEGKRIVAAGQVETVNACGAGVRPPHAVAVGSEAGTRRGAA